MVGYCPHTYIKNTKHFSFKKKKNTPHCHQYFLEKIKSITRPSSWSQNTGHKTCKPVFPAKGLSGFLMANEPAICPKDSYREFLQKYAKLRNITIIVQNITFQWHYKLTCMQQNDQNIPQQKFISARCYSSSLLIISINKLLLLYFHTQGLLFI